MCSDNKKWLKTTVVTVTLVLHLISADPLNEYYNSTHLLMYINFFAVLTIKVLKDKTPSVSYILELLFLNHIFKVLIIFNILVIAEVM